MKVTVFNLNTFPLKELFKGEEVEIEAQDYWRDKKGNVKHIDQFEANDFRGSYHPVPFDGSGKMVNDPRHFKMLKIEPVDHEDEATAHSKTVARCMAQGCKHVSPSPEELEAHTKVQHPGIETLLLPEVEEASARKKAKSA